ncbi:MAG: hypothetical protein J6B10_09830 [Lachnospiraceae bacterium]|nr:hypothetical protein [Lachnospiraceae bacterium]
MPVKLKNTRLYAVAFTVLIAAVCLILSLKVPFIYTVNDDLFMKNILSGAYLGAPDAHTVYMEYPLCALLAFLYRLQPEIPWYGICFFAFHAVSWGLMVYRLCGGSRIRWNIRTLAAFLLGMLLFASCGFYHIASMQFTVTAAVLGMAALVWFLTGDLGQETGAYLRDQAVTAIFVFLSFNVRRNVLLMLVPIAGMLWLRAAWQCYREKVAGSVTKLLGMAALSAAGVAVALLSYRIAYGDAGWQDYILYNDNATVLYDYYEWPDYEENKELYEELGISKEAYVGARDAYFLSMDSGIDSAAMVKLAERSNALHQERSSFGERCMTALREIGVRTVADTDRPLNLIVVSLYVLAAVGAVLWKKPGAFLSLGALWIGRMFSWMYVVYEGRYPMRITQSLLLAEAGVLAVILCRELPGIGDACKGSKKSWKKVLTAVVLAAYFLFLAAFGYVRLKHVFVENTWRLAESQDLRNLKDYCEEHDEYFYLVDTKSITNDTEAIFDTTGNRFEHYIVFGGWLSDSPAFLKKLELAGVSDTERAIVDGRARIIVENEERCPTGYLEDYFASRYPGSVMREVDCFGRNGDQFVVYDIQEGK